MRLRWFIFGLALGSVSSGAFAFQETKGGGTTDTPSSGQAASVKPPLNLNGTGTSIDTPPASSSGPEIRIPGLGKLGVLPKFDFGLELLYGASEPKGTDPNRGLPDPNGDVGIRGSLKHRF